MDIENLSWDKLSEINKCFIEELKLRSGKYNKNMTLNSLYILCFKKYISTLNNYHLSNLIIKVVDEMNKRRRQWYKVFISQNNTKLSRYNIKITENENGTFSLNCLINENPIKIIFSNPHCIYKYNNHIYFNIIYIKQKINDDTLFNYIKIFCDEFPRCYYENRVHDLLEILLK